MTLSAPDYIFVALYTIAKIAIAFILTRLFGIILKYKENYDLYISTSSLSVASLFSVKGTTNLFKKHGSTAIIPIFITLLIVLTEGFPTLMTKFTNAVRIEVIVPGLNLTASDRAIYSVPSYSGTKNIDILTGMPTIDVPRTSNDSLVWAGLGSLQNEYTFLDNLNYREHQRIHDNGHITFLEPEKRGSTRPLFSGYIMFRYGNISVGLSSMLRGTYSTKRTIINQTPVRFTAVLDYKNMNITAKDSIITSPFDFSIDISGDPIMKKNETHPSEFKFGKLSNEGGVEKTYIDPSLRQKSLTYHSFAKVAYFTEEYADYIIARSGYNIDSPAYTGFKHEDIIETKMNYLGKPQYEIDEALFLLGRTNASKSQLFFSVTTISPGRIRLAILSHASIHFKAPRAFEGSVRFVAQNLTVSCFPANHIDETELINMYYTNDNANAGINQKELKRHYATDKPIKLRTYGILAGTYNAFTNEDYDDIVNLPNGVLQIASLSEKYDPKAAILNLDLARTVSGACNGNLCVKLAHVYYQKELSLGVLLGICIPIFIALLFLVMTHRSRQDLFFADLADAIAAVTKGSSTGNNTNSIPPNPHYIKLVKSGFKKGHIYISIDDQILKREANDNQSLLSDEKVFYIKKTKY